MSRSPLHSALAALALAAAGCRPASPSPEVRPPSVRVEIAAARTVIAHLPVAGSLAPLPGRSVKVGALVPGRVDRVLVAEGDAVKAGQALAHVEARPLEQRREEARAQREQAKAALANARARLRRNETLLKDGIASTQEVEDARAALVAAQSAVKTTEAALGTTQVQLDRATLRAPIDGLVAAILVPAGQPVDGNGTPVVEVADLAQLELRAAVPASRVGEVAVGQRARLRVDGGGEVDGVVAAIAPIVDIATNTALVRVRIDNADGRLRGGQFARGALLGAPRSAITVPRGALLPGAGGEANVIALVLGDGTVGHRTVELGAEEGERVEVRDGLAPGDRVIVAGGYTLPDGARVDVAAALPTADGGAP